MRYFRVALPLCMSALFAATTVAQNAEISKPKEAVATVDGQTIYDGDLASSVQGQLLPLRNQEYEIKRKALDSLIEQKLLEAAAKKKRLTTEKLLAQEVDSKIQEPTEGELQGFYLALKDRYNRPFDEVKDQIRTGMKQAKIQQARQDYLKTLRADS